MASLKDWLDRLSPDIFATLRRFRFAVLLGLVAAILLIMQINETMPRGDDAMRALAGLWTGAALAVAGVLFAESRPKSVIAGLVLTYAAPIAAIALFQIRDTVWFVPYLLPAVAVLWLSVASATEISADPAVREAQQQRFWWLNQRAIMTAAFAVFAFAIVAVGTAAIERSLSVLFGLQSGRFFYNYVLPFAGAFLTPVYWLATIPRLGDFEESSLDQPDFLSRAVGYLGQFLLVPLLLVYAAILLAYTAQILITQSLPEGMIGWMVMGFTVTGAATWLVLHPPFMRQHLLVRLYRRWWFWLTVIPLVLYAIAVGVRIDAYGLTLERMLLIAGGLWAALLTILFLIPRLGDIRLIPALAALLLLIFSIGPWNIENGPRADQLARLDRALAVANGAGGKPVWSEGDAAIARGALQYLVSDRHADQRLTRVLAAHGITVNLPLDGRFDTEAAIGLPSTVVAYPVSVEYRKPFGLAVDISATPGLLGRLYLSQYAENTDYGLRVDLQSPSALVVSDLAATASAPEIRIDLGEWLARQSGDRLTDPVIDFAFAGRAYRIVVDELSVTSPIVDSLTGTLLAAPLP